MRGQQGRKERQQRRVGRSGEPVRVAFSESSRHLPPSLPPSVLPSLIRPAHLSTTNITWELPAVRRALRRPTASLVTQIACSCYVVSECSRLLSVTHLSVLFSV
ncbi:hypothetical protein E2C01_003408 [Portunus trituberculatus]|uniref:Uncharacterized protein n=1 Tax=Portunus trituberculatus TaxID=210409 RepID=A0A5B7CNS7_PORTR|nr:hypothetical protein [Portunus trituberculatus]